MAKAPGTPMGQHTVSKFLLKRFADKGDVAVFDRRDGRRQRRSFGSGIFETTFDAHDPTRSEAMWGSVETQAGITIRRLESGLPLKSDDGQTLRDLMAVHWARSRAIMTARDAITEGIVEDSKRKTLEARPHLLVQAYLTEVGLIPTTKDQLEWINDLVHGRVVAAGADQWHSERNVVNLDEARKMFARSAIQVGFTPPGSELVIGDAPVLVMKEGDPGVGPHHGVALGDASQIVMPITPRILLALGPTASVVTMTPDVVRWYNDRQWDGYQKWIVARPGGSQETRMRLEETLERMRRARTLSP